MNYEIRKVANGYMVVNPDWARENVRGADAIFVFETWEKTSDWLREQFTKVSGG